MSIKWWWSSNPGQAIYSQSSASTNTDHYLGPRDGRAGANIRVRACRRHSKVRVLVRNRSWIVANDSRSWWLVWRDDG